MCIAPSGHVLPNTDAAPTEIRAILESAARPADQVKLGALLVDMGRDAGLTAKEADAFAKLRDKAAIKPIGLK
ncbi:hypothetical protein ABFU19_21375 [Xanthomonas campestris]|nr:hypothetical protein [Xanthomonas campestris]MCC5091144.1 hypothetical protein [Xanthomonas campestris]